MPQAAAIIDVPTTGGTVRVYIPAPEPEGPGPAKCRPRPIETTGEDATREPAPVLTLRRSA